MRRVVVTGVGALTGFGNAEETWSSVVESKSCVSKIRLFDVEKLPVKIASQIPESFDLTKYIPVKDMKRNDRFMHLGVVAAVNAINDAGWFPTEEEDLLSTGVTLGSGIGGLTTLSQAHYVSYDSFMQGNKPRFSPFFVPASLVNLLTGYISIQYGYRGYNSSVVAACSTSAYSIADSARIIACGEQDVMIAGGAEAPVCYAGVLGFASMKALCEDSNDNPEKASRPWDVSRSGFVMSEGAGAMVLEEYEHAKKRGAKIYAELVGYGCSGDAYHSTSPHPEGKGACLSMKKALKSAKLNPEQIGYINAHGTSTGQGDLVELRGVQSIFGADKSVKMSSTKSSMGHLLGAAGVVEAIMSIYAMNQGVCPPTLNLSNPIDESMVDLIPNVAIEKKDIDYILSNSFGFGGTNASLVFGKI